MRRARLAPETDLPTGTGELHPPWPGEAVLLDGRTTFLRHTPPTTATAEPALYVHGLGGSSQNWTDVAGLLAGRLDGYALDLPGFGRSEPARRYTLAALADRVVRVIEHIDSGPVHLFGNSLGGAVSVRVAATRPDLVRTLTLISPAMPFVEAWRSAQGRFVPMLLIPRVERLAARRLAAMSGEELARQVIDICWGDPDSLPEQRRAEAVEEANRRLSVPWYADAYVRTFRGLVTSFLRSYLPGSGSLWRLAARVRAPTLVIWGRLDRLVDVGLAPRVAGTIPDSRLLVIDDIGHVAQMERPDLVARAVFGLLDERATVDRLATDELAGTDPARADRAGTDRPGRLAGRGGTERAEDDLAADEVDGDVLAEGEVAAASETTQDTVAEGGSGDVPQGRVTRAVDTGRFR